MDRSSSCSCGFCVPRSGLSSAVKNEDGTFTLVVTKDEAHIILALLGGTRDEPCWDIFNALDTLIDNRKYSTANVDNMELNCEYNDND